jgi:hypothetical protein
MKKINRKEFSSLCGNPRFRWTMQDSINSAFFLLGMPVALKIDGGGSGSRRAFCGTASNERQANGPSRIELRRSQVGATPSARYLSNASSARISAS